MRPQARVAAERLEGFRPYLVLLGRLHLGRRLQGKLDVADLVQETLAEACQSLDQFAGQGDAELAAWLGAILEHRLAHTFRYYARAMRDAGRECSLPALEESSNRLEAWLAAEQSSVSAPAQRKERAVRLAAALEQLPAAQREAVVLHHLEGLPVADVARQLGRRVTAVAGLLHRGLKKLHSLLQDLE
jgi:RNA polymerase sigma-70 factor (ECF subfamily)